jgi:hypothetical protein
MKVQLERKFAGHRLLDWMGAFTGLWIILGMYIDARAHRMLPGLESFFTPWHFVFYTGGLALGGTAALATYAWWSSKDAQAREPITRIWRAAPAGYGGALLGWVIFAISGVADLAWHLAFGIEVGLEPLLSPSHLGLAIGGGLMVLCPYRAALARKAQGLQSELDWPALLSITWTYSAVVFVTQHTIPMVDHLALVFGGEHELHQSFGAQKMFIQTVVLLAVLIHLDQRWTLRRYSGVVMMLGHGALVSLLMTHYQTSMEFWTLAGISELFSEGRIMLASCLMTGVAIELGLRHLRPHGLSPYLALIGGVWVGSMFFSVWALTDIEIHWRISGWMGMAASMAVLGWLAGLVVSKSEPVTN